MRLKKTNSKLAIIDQMAPEKFSFLNLKVLRPLPGLSWKTNDSTNPNDSVENLHNLHDSNFDDCFQS